MKKACLLVVVMFFSVEAIAWDGTFSLRDKSCQDLVTGVGRKVEICRGISTDGLNRVISFQVKLTPEDLNTEFPEELPKVGIWIQSGGVGCFYPMRVAKAPVAEDLMTATFYLSGVPFRLHAGFLLNRAWDNSELEFAIVVDGKWDSDYGRNYRVRREDFSRLRL